MIRAELLKLRLQRTPQVLAGLAVAVVAIVVGVTVGKDLTAAELADRANNAVYIFLPLAAAVLGGFVVGSEYRQDTLKRLAAVGPRRGRLLAAKAAVLLGSILAASVVLMGLAVGAMAVLASNAGTSFPTDTLWPMFASGTLSAVTVGLIAFGLSLITRSDSFAMIGVLALPLVLDPVVGALASGIEKFTYSGAISGVTASFEKVLGTGGDPGPSNVFGPAVAAVVLLAWVAVPVVAGTRRFLTADI